MLFKKSKMKLSFEQYSDLVQEVTIDSYYRIFTDKTIEEVLSLDNTYRNKFAFEYVCVSLFFMVDMFSDSFLNEDILYKLMDDVTEKIFFRVLNKSITQEDLNKHKTYYYEKSEYLSNIFDRSGESLLCIAKYLVSIIHEDDAVGNLPRHQLVTGMLIDTLKFYRNILDNTSVLHNKDGVIFEVIN